MQRFFGCLACTHPLLSVLSNNVPFHVNYVNPFEKIKRGKEDPGLSFYFNCTIQEFGVCWYSISEWSWDSFEENSRGILF